MLVRIVNMRGIDLNVFDFDLTWAGFFMNADDYVYGRYGSRDEGPAAAGLSLDGLKYAMQQALKAFQQTPRAKPTGNIAESSGFPTRVENYPAASRLKKDACIHCHQVHNFQQELLWSKKIWTKDNMWLYPPPKTIGLELELDQGDKVESVKRDSPASRTGLQEGDVLKTLNGIAIASAADVQFALNKASKSGSVPVLWTRDGRDMSAKIRLETGWRKSDISWRGSMWTMPPAFGMYGQNLTAARKKELGLSEKRLAFRQGNYVPPKTKRAGIRAGDIVIGVDGKKLEMTMLQFNVYIRANYNVGDKVKFNIIRNGKRLEIPMTLPVHPRL